MLAPDYRNCIRLATAEDFAKGMKVYSHSISTAIQTCPKWGIIRYVKGLYFKSEYRAMALEAGSLVHEVFAAIRIWQLARKQGLEQHAVYTGERLFPDGRFAECWVDIEGDPKNELEQFVFGVIATSNFYDDPRDKFRTIQNIEITSLRFIEEMLLTMDRNHVWVADKNDPTAPVGIECSIAIVVDESFIYIGTIDGISFRPEDERIRLEELKTASRLDEAFRRKFEVDHQPTGYMAMAELAYELPPIEKGRVIGIKPKQTGSNEDYISFEEVRDDDKKWKWLQSLRFSHALVESYGDDPLNAPMFTHSCNRYFRPCGLVDLCACDSGEQQWIYESLEPAPLSPSQEAIQEKLKSGKRIL